MELLFNHLPAEPEKTLEERLSYYSNKQIYAQILLGILRHVPGKKKYDNDTYEIELQKRLKFKNIDDYKLLRCCIDLLEDTDSAIIEFQKWGLGEGRVGEDYLRLYGVLNAIYQQVLAIVELADLFNVPHKTQFKEELMQLRIIVLRNKIGAHTVNYKIDSTKKNKQTNKDFFKISQVTLRNIESIQIVSHRGKSEKINLVQVIKEYNSVAERIIESICSKAIKSLFPNNNENKDWLMERMGHVEQRKVEID